MSMVPRVTEVQLIEKAKAAAARGAYDEVLSTCSVLRAEYPECRYGYGLAAIAFRKLGQVDDSNAMVWNSIKSIGLRAANLVTMADTAMDFQDWEEAIRRWKDLRAAFPDQPQGYTRAAVAFRNIGNFNECDRLLEEKKSRMKFDVQDYNLWANSAIDRGQWNLAADRLSELSKVFPREPTEYLAGARVLSAFKNKEEKVDRLKYEGTKDSLKKEFELLWRGMRHGNYKLQDLIDSAKWIVRCRAVTRQTSGAERLFDLAQNDKDLAKVLGGEKIAAPVFNSDRPIRAVFYFPTTTQTDNLTPLLERMSQDPRFSPIILCSRNGNHNNDDSFAFFSQTYSDDPRITVVDGGSHVDENISPYEIGADIVFYHTPYTHHGIYPFFLQAEFVARHTRVAHISYGYFLLTLEGTASHIYDNKHIRSAEMVFSESDVSDRVYRECFGDERVFMTGYPKFDRFRKHLDSEPFERRVENKEKLDVIWTPHWQMAEDPTGGTQTSNFMQYVDIMLNLSKRKDVVLHVRPHPLLRPRLKVIGKLELDEYDAIMEKFQKRGAIFYPANKGVSYVEALMSADVLISDFSSLASEFFITERPIIFCRTDEVWNNGKWIGPFGKKLLEQGCYAVDSEKELVSTLSTIITKRKHPKMQSMRRIIRENNLFPEGSSCERIMDVVAHRVVGK